MSLTANPLRKRGKIRLHTGEKVGITPKTKPRRSLPRVIIYYDCILNYLPRNFSNKKVVELSCVLISLEFISSRIELASCLPNSTPHWS